MRQSPTSVSVGVSAPRLFQTRLAVLFAALSVSAGVFLPYFPLWLETVGLTPAEIAMVLGAPMFLRVLTTPVLSSWADRASDRATVLALVIPVSLLLSLGFFLPPTYALLLLLSLGLAVVWPVQTTLADSIALSGVRRFGADYSRMRVWGSISFLLANFAGGIVLARSGAGSVPLMFSASLLACFLASFLVPRVGPPQAQRTHEPAVPIMRRRRLMLFLTATGFFHASHGFLWAFASIYWKSLGIDDTTIGALWAFSVVAETALFFAFPRWLAHLGAVRMASIAGAASVIRWCLFPMIWPLGWSLAGFFAVQALHALSTGLLILAIQKMIAESVPESQTGAAQGLHYFTSGFGMAAATVASGPLYATFGANGFLAMAGVAGLGLVFAVLAARSAP
ncbi:MAG TPA: MFS transporter [Mesorhizobium sp.]|jgi:PPP family 3-phenylpropionic acid transporter|nr:MFS transporter [Mesorhizobium sp.]